MIPSAGIRVRALCPEDYMSGKIPACLGFRKQKKGEKNMALDATDPIVVNIQNELAAARNAATAGQTAAEAARTTAEAARVAAAAARAGVDTLTPEVAGLRANVVNVANAVANTATVAGQARVAATEGRDAVVNTVVPAVNAIRTDSRNGRGIGIAAAALAGIAAVAALWGAYRQASPDSVQQAAAAGAAGAVALSMKDTNTHLGNIAQGVVDLQTGQKQATDEATRAANESAEANKALKTLSFRVKKAQTAAEDAARAASAPRPAQTRSVDIVLPDGTRHNVSFSSPSL